MSSKYFWLHQKYWIKFIYVKNYFYQFLQKLFWFYKIKTIQKWISKTAFILINSVKPDPLVNNRPGLISTVIQNPQTNQSRSFTKYIYWLIIFFLFPHSLSSFSLRLSLELSREFIFFQRFKMFFSPISSQILHKSIILSSFWWKSIQFRWVG